MDEVLSSHVIHDCVPSEIQFVIEKLPLSSSIARKPVAVTLSACDEVGSDAWLSPSASSLVDDQMIWLLSMHNHYRYYWSHSFLDQLHTPNSIHLYLVVMMQSFSSVSFVLFQTNETNLVVLDTIPEVLCTFHVVFQLLERDVSAVGSLFCTTRGEEVIQKVENYYTRTRFNSSCTAFRSFVISRRARCVFNSLEMLLPAITSGFDLLDLDMDAPAFRRRSGSLFRELNDIALVFCSNSSKLPAVVLWNEWVFSSSSTCNFVDNRAISCCSLRNRESNSSRSPIVVSILYGDERKKKNLNSKFQHQLLTNWSLLFNILRINRWSESETSKLILRKKKTRKNVKMIMVGVVWWYWIE